MNCNNHDRCKTQRVELGPGCRDMGPNDPFTHISTSNSVKVKSRVLKVLTSLPRLSEPCERSIVRKICFSQPFHPHSGHFQDYYRTAVIYKNFDSANLSLNTEVSTDLHFYRSEHKSVRCVKSFKLDKPTSLVRSGHERMPRLFSAPRRIDMQDSHNICTTLSLNDSAMEFICKTIVASSVLG